MGLVRRGGGDVRDIDDDEEHRDRPQSSLAQRVAAGRHRFLCRFFSAIHAGITSSSLRELEAVALATNVIVFMKRGTKALAEGECLPHSRVVVLSFPHLLLLLVVEL